MKITNSTKGTVIATDAIIAGTVASRLRGLLGRASLPPGEAMVITQCRAIHMFFMRFSVDALFVDAQGSVIGVVKHIRPFRMSPYFWKASYVIEMPVGTIEQSRTGKGDRIEIH